MSEVGRLVVVYQLYSMVGLSAGVNLLDGVDPSNEALMLATADQLADLLSGTMPPQGNLTEYRTFGPNGEIVLSGALSATYVGNHSTAPGIPQYYSSTLRALGRSTTVPPGELRGRTSMMWHVGNAYGFTPATKYLLALDPELQALRTFLENSNVVWADTQGNKATVAGRVAVQFNAATQRRYGT